MMPSLTESCLSVCVLASGSKGNAIYISDGRTAILVDAGLSGVEITKRMQSAGLSIESLRAILVSHEHSDHVRGVGVLAKKHERDVATEQTEEAENHHGPYNRGGRQSQRLATDQLHDPEVHARSRKPVRSAPAG